MNLIIVDIIYLVDFDALELLKLKFMAFFPPLPAGGKIHSD